jgi:transposase-like protein
LVATRERLVQRLKADGVDQREIARRIGVSEKAIRKLLRRLGWKATPPVQRQLPLETVPTADPNLSAVCATEENSVPSQDTDPNHRCADRLLARLGLLEDAPLLFGSATAVPRAGVLLALPLVVSSGVLACAQKIYGSLGPAFYGLRNSLLTLLLMALWRIKRPEGLKEYSPQDLGRALGLDRAPEVKTLRRKLTQLAAAGRAAQLGQALAQHRVALRGTALGFLYTDGHVRVYHGQHALPKTHVAPAPDHARFQNRARKAGPENLERLAAH